MGAGKEEVRIRKMTEADMSKVKKVDRELVGPERALSWPLRVEAHWWVYRGMPNFVAEVGDEVIGFILGDVRGSEYGTYVGGWIDMLGVVPRYQRRGIGRKLVEAFCTECCEQGLKVRIIVESDERAAKFLAPMGFRVGSQVCYEK